MLRRPGLRAWSRNSDGARETSDLDPGGSRRTFLEGPPSVALAVRERVKRPVAEDLHPDLGEDSKRRPMDRLHLVGGQDLEWPERIDQSPPGQLA